MHNFGGVWRGQIVKLPTLHIVNNFGAVELGRKLSACYRIRCVMTSFVRL
jgi:hypothetical protein